MLKRVVDIMFSFSGLLALAPLLLLIAVMVKVDDGGPVFYRQIRVGRRGRMFQILKFRTMRVNADTKGPSITRSGDSRITRVGVSLRKMKLDELPQLFNVLNGEMSFVGPRPEVPKYVELYTDQQRAVLEYRPGITDVASIEFRDEEKLLAAAIEPESFYTNQCVPKKIELNLNYARSANVLTDFFVILKTLVAILK